MKTCPQCRQTYSDDGLNFCLNDGSVLSFEQPSPEAKTVFFERPRTTNEYRPEPQVQPPAVWQNQQNIQPAQYGALAPQLMNRDRSMPIISLILGIVSMFLVCFVIGIPLGLGAIITGGLAIRNESREPDRFSGRGMAIGGIVTGAIGLAMGFLIFILYIAG
jgi:hypothetical protein